MSSADSAPKSHLDLGALLDSWTFQLRVERKSPNTIRGYRTGVERFLEWARESGNEPRLDRPTVGVFMAHLLDSGAEPSTAATRHLALRRFSAWLLEEGETDSDELLNSKPPKIDTKIVPTLSEEQLSALVKATQGTDFRDRRDEALVRLMIETGMRAGEVVDLRLDDIDLARGLVLVRKSKTGKGRIVPIGPHTVRAIDRYIRHRRRHDRASSKDLWLGEQQKQFGYYGLYRTLQRRAESAGIRDFHPHVLRHTAAHRWLAAGGSEGGLMSVAGWSQRGMIDRYAAHAAASRAAEEARNLNLGDL